MEPSDKLAQEIKLTVDDPVESDQTEGEASGPSLELAYEGEESAGEKPDDHSAAEESVSTAARILKPDGGGLGPWLFATGRVLSLVAIGFLMAATVFLASKGADVLTCQHWLNLGSQHYKSLATSKLAADEFATGIEHSISHLGPKATESYIYDVMMQKIVPYDYPNSPVVGTPPANAKTLVERTEVAVDLVRRLMNSDLTPAAMNTLRTGLSTLGNVAENQGALKRAYTVYKTASLLEQKRQSEGCFCVSAFKLAKVCVAQKNYDEARQWIDKSFDAYEIFVRPPSEGYISSETSVDGSQIIQLANTLAAAGRIDDAKHLLERGASLNTGRSAGAYDEVVEALKDLKKHFGLK